MYKQMPCFKHCSASNAIVNGNVQYNDATLKKRPPLTPETIRRQRRQAAKQAYNIIKHGGKPPDTGSHKETGEATYFHTEGEPWESKRFALIKLSEVERMQNMRPPTDEQLEAELLARKEEQRFNNAETERLRKYFQAIDDERKAREATVDEFQEEDNTRRAKLLEKALIAKHEQDEQVQKVNRAIQEAKCCSVWKAQMKERRDMESARYKSELKKEYEHAEFQKSLHDKQMKEDLIKRKMREKYAAEVRKQIDDHEKLRFLEDERVQIESCMLRDANEALENENRKLAEEARKRKENYCKELSLNLEIAANLQRLQSEQDHEDDKRINKYLKQIEDRKKQMQEIVENKANEKRRSQNYLFELQQKIMDATANREELRYLAERERVDRKHRLEERERTQKRIHMAEEMRQTYHQQMQYINEMRSCYFAQHERELAAYNAELQAIQEQIKTEAEELKEKKNTFRIAVKKQIEGRELERRREVEDIRFETQKQREAEEKRNEDIKKVIQLKLDKVRKTKCLSNNQMNSLEARVKNFGNRRLVT